MMWWCISRMSSLWRHEWMINPQCQIITLDNLCSRSPKRERSNLEISQPPTSRILILLHSWNPKTLEIFLFNRKAEYFVWWGAHFIQKLLLQVKHRVFDLQCRSLWTMLLRPYKIHLDKVITTKLSQSDPNKLGTLHFHLEIVTKIE